MNLYRHFSSDGTLLYVGVSLSAVTRLAQHNKDSEWASEIVRVEIETLPDRATALKAEAQAIRSERPVWNKTHRVSEKIPMPAIMDIPSREECFASSVNAFAKSGLTDREISEKIDRPVSTVWRWRTGKRLPGAEEVGKLAAALGCHPRDIRPDQAAIYEG